MATELNSQPVDVNRMLLETAQQYGNIGAYVKARISGLAPGILFHSGEAMVRAVDAAAEHRKGGKRSKFVPAYDQEAEWGCYRGDDGKLVLLAAAVHRMLVEAGREFRKQGSRANMSKAAASAITPQPTNGAGWALLDADGKPVENYDVHVARVVVNRASIMRARPHLLEWQCDLVFGLDTDAIELGMLAQMLGHGLSRIGLGDWRPEKNGVYGRARVVDISVEQAN